MKNLEKLEIYIKAMHIVHLVNGFMLTIPEDDEYLQATKGFMMEDASIMAAKIAGAEGGDLYSIRMQNASIVREHAMHLYIQVGSLRFHKNYKDVEYVDMLRNEIEEFRMLFIEWVAAFDPNNHVWDAWCLFNPPGAVPPDPSENDSDDDFFDPNIFFDDDDDDE